LIDLVFRLIQIVVNLLWLAVFAHAIMSWLISFNVINTWNETVRAIFQALQKIVDPIERPIRRILPDFGPLDLSPLVALLLLSFVSSYVVPYLRFVAHGGPVM